MIEIRVGIWRASKGDTREAIICKIKFRRVKTVINLQTSFWEIITNSRYANSELRWCIANSISLVDFAWSGLFPPRRADILAALAVIANHDNHPVLLHCRRHRERTGFLTACFQIAIGVPFEKAYQEWRDTGCNWLTWKLWKRALKNWSNR